MKGNKRTLLVLLAIVALLGVSLFGLLQLLDWLMLRNADPAADDPAAAGVAANGPADKLDASNRWDVVFPAYQDGRTAANAAAYDYEPFIVTFCLPEGWLTVLPPVEERTGTAPYTPVQLVDETGAVMGTLGFEPAGGEAGLSLEDFCAVLQTEVPAVRITLNLSEEVITPDCFAGVANSLTVSPAA
ncbi:MAG: hypothetical protein IJ412_02460 [Oscillospiraceae bacterium]|nr:hypothetical protein [Oscillospiraceae bacterium]